MTTTVAMHEKSLEHIRGRLDALGLDVNVLTFGSNGRFVSAKPIPSSQV